jgi:hypothetical protein
MRRPAGGGARRISSPRGHKGSLSVRLRRASGVALKRGSVHNKLQVVAG